jgi:site-specific DNA-methyltransferase (adenine-specific)
MEKKDKRRRTKTSKFGSSGREGHDSTPFYNSRLYAGLPTEKKVRYSENPLHPKLHNKIFNSSSENMKELPNNSIHLMVTSPPYIPFYFQLLIRLSSFFSY